MRENRKRTALRGIGSDGMFNREARAGVESDDSRIPQLPPLCKAITAGRDYVTSAAKRCRQTISNVRLRIKDGIGEAPRHSEQGKKKRNDWNDELGW